jgi:hypothetical protein
MSPLLPFGGFTVRICPKYRPIVYILIHTIRVLPLRIKYIVPSQKSGMSGYEIIGCGSGRYLFASMSGFTPGTNSIHDLIVVNT